MNDLDYFLIDNPRDFNEVLNAFITEFNLKAFEIDELHKEFHKWGEIMLAIHNFQGKPQLSYVIKSPTIH